MVKLLDLESIVKKNKSLIVPSLAEGFSFTPMDTI